jgi:hypothetical protein
VLAANQALDEYKYHVVGGNAGTVSPMGWTFQGGHAGAKAGRMYGMGVDQVLQVEMVLPNGHHVKFGPTEWEDASADGFVVPRTTVVSGVCRSNPDEEDEEKWIWEACPEDFDVDFYDLWFAVRGGGGGTWGVVTSVSLQLHPYLPYKNFGFALVEECSPLAPKYEEFRAKYLMTPSILNVTKERSIACGTSDSSFHCYGDEDVLGAWERFLELNNIPLEASPCLGRRNPDAKSFGDMMIMGQDSRFPGKVPDFPPPTPLPDSILGFVLVPQSWIDESEENFDFYLQNGSNPYYSHGVATASFSDQANSLSQSQRDAAAMAYLSFAPLEEQQANFWSNVFPNLYDISDKTKFPPVFNANHAGPLLTGPLKEDWTKACPYELTLEERKEKCISSQEAIYGTELLNRLEAIKMAVDPNFMFNCHNCIANNLDLAKASHSEDDESVPPTTIDEPSKASNETSGASAVSFYAAVISATVLSLFGATSYF